MKDENAITWDALLQEAKDTASIFGTYSHETGPVAQPAEKTITKDVKASNPNGSVA
jgi:hypothetical protein